MKKLVLPLVLISAYAFGQDNNTNTGVSFLEINSDFSYKMLEPNEDLRKVRILMEERKKGVLNDRKLIIGGALIALADYQVSNIDSKFGYLMRHPTATNQIGKEVSEAVLHSFQTSFTYSANNWIAAHAELLYNPQQSFGSGVITDLQRNLIQLRKAYVAFGDLNKFPVYGALGKMDAPFGQMGSVSPFTNSTMWHTFGGLGYGAQVSFQKWGLHATVMAVQGGAQFRALNTPVGDSTSVPSKINNFTADVNYTIHMGNEMRLVAGGSYVHGSAYCHTFPVFHFNPCPSENPASTFYGRFIIQDRLLLQGSYGITAEVWQGTHNPAPPLDVFEAHKVSSMDVGAKYFLNKTGKVIYAASAEFSNFRAGPDGSPWERQNQIVVGFQGKMQNATKLFLELFRTEGFAPLNWISGSSDFAPFPPGVTHSERDAFSHGIVLGAQVTF